MHAARTQPGAPHRNARLPPSSVQCGRSGRGAGAGRGCRWRSCPTGWLRCRSARQRLRGARLTMPLSCASAGRQTQPSGELTAPRRALAALCLVGGGALSCSGAEPSARLCAPPGRRSMWCWSCCAACSPSGCRLARARAHCRAPADFLQLWAWWPHSGFVSLDLILASSLRLHDLVSFLPFCCRRLRDAPAGASACCPPLLLCLCSLQQSSTLVLTHSFWWFQAGLPPL